MELFTLIPDRWLITYYEIGEGLNAGGWVSIGGMICGIFPIDRWLVLQLVHPIIDKSDK